jgi:hypothetical protein
MVDVNHIIQEMTVLLRNEAIRHSVTIHSQLDAMCLISCLTGYDFNRCL